MSDLDWADAVGALGALLLLVTYHGAAIRRIQVPGIAYLVLNLVGAGLLLVWFIARPVPTGPAVWILLVAVALLLLSHVFRRK